ncbi:hypothetical protein V6N12_055848 [Hibiscus sabdariffa]|uniref:Uncharacterized protein n=1 Tax=Hibiscus sabdariffa TaxID=183260 RepID=A0ABR2CQR2_9ROSI
MTIQEMGPPLSAANGHSSFGFRKWILTLKVQLYSSCHFTMNNTLQCSWTQESYGVYGSEKEREDVQLLRKSSAFGSAAASHVKFCHLIPCLFHFYIFQFWGISPCQLSCF